MILEPVELVTTWLKHETYGVNALLRTLLVDSSDSVPQVEGIFDEENDEQVMNRQDPQDAPAIYVMADDPVYMDPPDPTGVRQKIPEFPIVIRYLTRSTDLRKIRRDTRYTIRAIVKSLNNLNLPTNRTSRTKRSVYMVGIKEITALGGIREQVGDATSVTGAVIVVWDVDDQDPT